MASPNNTNEASAELFDNVENSVEFENWLMNKVGLLKSFELAHIFFLALGEEHPKARDAVGRRLQRILLDDPVLARTAKMMSSPLP
jgi:hypothetical protein